MKKPMRKIFNVPDGLAARVTAYQQQFEIVSEAEAYRRLVEAGLDAIAKKKRPASSS